MPRNLHCNVLGSSPNVQNLVSKYSQNIANIWFQKSLVLSWSWHVQVSVSSGVFAPSLSLATPMSRLSLEDFGRDSSSACNPLVLKLYGQRVPPPRFDAGWPDEKGFVSTNKFLKFRPNIVPNCNEDLFSFLFFGLHSISGTELHNFHLSTFAFRMHLFKAAKASHMQNFTV